MRVATPRELEHAHAREPEGVAELVHVVGDGAEVLGEDGQVTAETVRHRTEEVMPGHLDP